MTTFSISFVFKGREFRSCYGINFLSESAIDFKKSYFSVSKKWTQIPQHGILLALLKLVVPQLSEQTREFYIFTWQTSVFVSESKIKEVPWNQKNIDRLYNNVWKTLRYIEKGSQPSSFFIFLSAHNPEFKGQITKLVAFWSLSVVIPESYRSSRSSWLSRNKKRLTGNWKHES